MQRFQRMTTGICNACFVIESKQIELVKLLKGKGSRQLVRANLTPVSQTFDGIRRVIKRLARVFRGTCFRLANRVDSFFPPSLLFSRKRERKRKRMSLFYSPSTSTRRRKVKRRFGRSLSLPFFFSSRNIEASLQNADTSSSFFPF